MRDPHVVLIRYHLKTTDTISFRTFPPPAPVDDDRGPFRVHLEDGIARFEFRDHFASVQEAREVTDEFVRAWELDAALQHGQAAIFFEFKDAEVIDRNPPPPRSPDIDGKVHDLTAADLIGSAPVLGSPTLVVVWTEYPRPPRHFAIAPDVETLWYRYQGALKGREKLLGMAYFCLSMIEDRSGGRQQAARKYCISRKVLDRLGELSSLGGDEKTARKVNGRSHRRPLAPDEEKWVHEAIKAIIHHVAEADVNPSLTTLTMNDLPKL